MLKQAFELKKEKLKVWRSEKTIGFQSNFTHLIRFDHSSKNDLKI